MRHRNHLTGRWQTNVPYEVQSAWLTDVVYPAIVGSSNPATMSYVNFTLDEWLWKATSHSRFSKTKVTSVSAQSLDALQNAMRYIIKEHDELAMFGSFFFVMDSRGTKTTTSALIAKDECPYQALRNNYPSLDWEYMMKRENGQLLMDLGMGFHPDPDDQVPRIGLWKLDKLSASYAAAGMNKGNTFYFNTLSNYGSMQSEMDAVRGAAVQLCFRSTYNLVYEIYRRPGSTDSFCSDEDAYRHNTTYTHCMDGFKQMFLGAVEKSYGTRDEIRGSGLAIKQVLKQAPGKVSTTVSLQTLFYICLHR
jgi:hypothetical protein